MLSACSDIVAEHYKTYDEAITAGAATRGWLPAFVPRTANDIDLIHDLDTNYQWLHFRAGLDSLQSISQNMKVLSLSEIKKDKIVKPKGIKKWPPELDAIMFATPRASFRFFKSCPATECLCIAIDLSNGDVFGWTCQLES
jgi:hypothetical protein